MITVAAPNRNYEHTQISSISSTIAADNNTCTYIIHYSIEHIAFSAEYTLSTTIVILIQTIGTF